MLQERKTNASIVEALEIPTSLFSTCPTRAPEFYGHITRRGVDNSEETIDIGNERYQRDRYRYIEIEIDIDIDRDRDRYKRL